MGKRNNERESKITGNAQNNQHTKGDEWILDSGFKTRESSRHGMKQG